MKRTNIGVSTFQRSWRVAALFLCALGLGSAAPVTYTLNGVLGTPPISGPDVLELAGDQFQLIGTIDSDTPPTSTGDNSAIYTFSSVTLNIGALTVALPNVPVTFSVTPSGIPTVSFSTSINLQGNPVAVSAVIGLPSGTFTSTVPSAFPLTNITAGTNPTLGSILTYGSATDATTLTITGTLEADAGGPALAANPANLAFGFFLGGPTPPPQTLEVTAGTILPVTVSTSGESWITATISASSTPAVVSVTVDPTGLTPGTYNSTVNITSAGISNSPLSVPVQFVVSNTPPPNVGSQYPPLFRGEFTQVAPQGFGDRQNGWAWGMEWFKGKLYVGTNRAFHCVETYAIHRVLPNYQPYPPRDPDISCASDFNDLPLQAEIWSWTPDTDTWTRVYQSPLSVPNPDSDKPSNKFIAADIAYRGMQIYTEADGTQALYISGVCSKAIHPLANPVTGVPAVPGARILRTVDGVNFTPLPEDPGTFLGDADFASFRGMTVYNGCLYGIAGTLQGAGVIISSCNPSLGDNAWQQVSPPGLQYFEVATYNGFLYATQSAQTGFSVVKSDGSGWPNLTFTTVLPDDGYRKIFPNVDGLSLKEFNGDLYVGGDGIHSFFGAEMFRVHPDDSWDLLVGNPRNTPIGYKAPLSGLGPGFGWFLNAHMWRMEVFDDRLYVGTFDLSTTFRSLPIIDNLSASEVGFDLWWTQNGSNWSLLDQNGFEDEFNFGVRNMKKTDWGLFLGTANYFYGLKIYRGVPAGFNFPPLVNPDDPTFIALEGSSEPLSQQLQISSVSTPGQFVVTASTTSPAGSNWLQVAPGSLTPPTKPANTPLTVTANPTGLAVGTYTSTINFVSPTTNVQRQIPVTLEIGPFINVNPGTLTFQAVQEGALPTAQSFIVGADGAPTPYTAVATVANPTGGNWLQVTPSTGTVPWPQTASLQVSVNQAGLAPGTYNGTITVTTPAQAVQTVTVTLVVTSPSFTAGTQSLSFSYIRGNPPPATIGLPVSSNGAPVSFTVGVNSSTTPASSGLTTTAVSSGWLSVAAANGIAPKAPAQTLILVSANPTSLGPGHYVGSLTITAPDSSTGSQTIPITLSVQPGTSTTQVTPPPAEAASVTVPALANGQGWQTSFLLINTDSDSQPVGLNFWSYNGGSLSLPLTTAGSTTTYSDTIPAGGLNVVQTDGSGTSPQQGWAALSAGGTVGGTVILTAQSGIEPPSEVGLPLSSPAGQKLLMPFDETQQYKTTLALTNTGTAAATAVLTFVDNTGQAIPITGTVTVPANGHYSGELGSSFPPLAGKRGVVLVTSAGGLSGIGYRFNGTAYTALPVLTNVPGLSKTIPHLINGAGWKSSILLVNTSPNSASFTLNFYAPDGSPLTLPLGNDGVTSSLTGTIGAGQLRLVQTDGTGTSATEGSAALITSAAIGGAAIFTAPLSTLQEPAEAASPLTTYSATTLYFPFDLTTAGLGLSTTIELANPSASPASITLTFTDSTGKALSETATATIPAHGHYESILGTAFPALQGTAGVVRVKSSAGLIGVGIRYNGSNFTSFPAIVPGS